MATEVWFISWGNSLRDRVYSIKERKEVGCRHFMGRRNERNGVGMSYFKVYHAKGSTGYQIVEGGEK
jgi:hypothetical protein